MEHREKWLHALTDPDTSCKRCNRSSACPESISSAGGVIFEAVDAVRAFGAIPQFITVIVDRGGTCAQMAQEAGIDYEPMLSATDLGYDFGS